jgi:hypothetical protein
VEEGEDVEAGDAVGGMWSLSIKVGLPKMI